MCPRIIVSHRYETRFSGEKAENHFALMKGFDFIQGGLFVEVSGETASNPTAKNSECTRFL